MVPLIASLGRWAARSPWHDPTLQMSHVSVIMSLQTLISPDLSKGIDARIGFNFGDVTYVTHVHDGRLVSSGLPPMAMAKPVNHSRPWR